MGRITGLQAHKTLLSSTDTSMNLGWCCSAQTGHGSWVCELLHWSLFTFTVNPMQACRWDSLFPSSWNSKDAYRWGSKKSESIVSRLSGIPSTTAPSLCPQPEAALKWVGRRHKSEPEHVPLWPNLCPAPHSCGHRFPVRKTHLLKLHCSLGG